MKFLVRNKYIIVLSNMQMSFGISFFLFNEKVVTNLLVSAF